MAAFDFLVKTSSTFALKSMVWLVNIRSAKVCEAYILTGLPPSTLDIFLSLFHFPFSAHMFQAPSFILWPKYTVILTGAVTMVMFHGR